LVPPPKGTLFANVRKDVVGLSEKHSVATPGAAIGIGKNTFAAVVSSAKSLLLVEES
jgi:hypothetical protein